MSRTSIRAALYSVTLALGSLAVLPGPAGAVTNRAPGASASSKKTATATTLPISTVPTTQAAVDPNAPSPTGKILMLKLYVDDLAKAEQFYGSVFGANVALRVGERAHIVTFPDGGPGLVLLQRQKGDKKKVGGFIVQVPSLDTSKALALANGATEQGTFAGNPGSQAAKSVDVLDPWGNQVEILQLG